MQTVLRAPSNPHDTVIGSNSTAALPHVRHITHLETLLSALEQFSVGAGRNRTPVSPRKRAVSNPPSAPMTLSASTGYSTPTNSSLAKARILSQAFPRAALTLWATPLEHARSTAGRIPRGYGATAGFSVLASQSYSSLPNPKSTRKGAGEPHIIVFSF
jgi:hypothetical protein